MSGPGGAPAAAGNHGEAGALIGRVDTARDRGIPCGEAAPGGGRRVQQAVVARGSRPGDVPHMESIHHELQ
jgi:hypothetical protein